ncbi:GAF domain-containing protein [Hymenobacter cheonanensis]|uniref:GAF domain-containing protein n=1 Tax=Hymenobacter sp. CA2-7 TaxID=3063993 RepID=UPI002712E402|nr:GAF domain-containing protein [Hymenobacter sp. CA2-7]MDO7887224.1 GAF domain-containing protein [Hymenobacter sp. CA2-7]
MTSNFPASLIPAHDAARLRTLHQFQIVNTTPEQIFDDYVAWAAQLFGVPISLISLVDADYVWFKALAGATGIPGLARNESMCSAAILSGDDVVISDYKPESCQLIKPDVAQAIGLNFYAGAALVAQDDSRLGMLAVIGKEPRGFSAAEADLLTRLAGLVSRTIELRYRYLAADQLAEWEDAQHELSKVLDDNAALARYLASRNQGIDLEDAEVTQPIVRCLENVDRVLTRRLG